MKSCYPFAAVSPIQQIEPRTSLYSGEARVCLGGRLRPDRGRSMAERSMRTRDPLSGDFGGVWGGVVGGRCGGCPRLKG